MARRSGVDHHQGGVGPAGTANWSSLVDGPVVNAARQALAAGDVDVVLPFVPADGEPEVRDAFDLAAKARAVGGEAAEVADRWFFETAVRVHRT